MYVIKHFLSAQPCLGKPQPVYTNLKAIKFKLFGTSFSLFCYIMCGLHICKWL